MVSVVSFRRGWATINTMRAGLRKNEMSFTIPVDDLRTPRALTCSTRIQTEMVEPTPYRVALEKIAIERITMVSVLRAGLAAYDLFTERDIRAFMAKNRTVQFVWTGDYWQLAESVGDLQKVTIKLSH